MEGNDTISLNEWLTHFKKLHNESIAKDLDVEFTDKILDRLKALQTSNRICDIMDTPFDISEMYDG